MGEIFEQQFLDGDNFCGPNLSMLLPAPTSGGAVWVQHVTQLVLHALRQIRSVLGHVVDADVDVDVTLSPQNE